MSYPGVQKQVKKGNVILTKLPVSSKKLKKTDVMISTFFWENMLADRVLLFGGNSVLCANSPRNLTDFDAWDYVGGPWSEFEGRGGDGGLSLRNRTAVLQALNELSLGSSMAGKKEDSMLVRHWIASPASSIRLASAADTAAFGLGWPGTSLGATGTYAGMKDQERQKMIDYCPELKLFFPSLHAGACFGATPDPITCFEYLCVNAGLHCNSDMTKTWTDLKKNVKTTLTLKIG